MATDLITDNRILVDDAEDDATWVGSTSPALDDQTFIQGIGSIADQSSDSVRYWMFNNGTPIDVSNNIFYIWVNCGIVGILETKAAGGFRIRFAGASEGDYIEFNVGGNDSWPQAIQGGWVMFVVDIELPPSATGGTIPLTTAIQHFGIASLTNTMTKVGDNTWVDAIWRHPRGNPAIIVEGQLDGTTPWSWTEILSASEAGGWGVAKTTTAGAIALNGPIQFFTDTADSHSFDDANTTVLWDSQEFVSESYVLTVTGSAAGNTNFTLGVKTGDGDDASGAQGSVITAGVADDRWFLSASSADQDSCNLYGCAFTHGADYLLAAPNIEIIGTQFLDCSRAEVFSGSLWLKNTVIDADTLDDVAFLFSDDLTDTVVRSTFQFSDGHAIELIPTSSGNQTSKGNIFVGYGVDDSTDAAITNNTGGNITMSIVDGGTDPTVETTANTQTLAQVSITLSGMTSGSEVIVQDAGTEDEIAKVENVGPTGIFVFQADAGTFVDIFIHAIDQVWQSIDGFEIPALDTELPIQQQFDRNYDNPT